MNFLFILGVLCRGFPHMKESVSLPPPPPQEWKAPFSWPSESNKDLALLEGLLIKCCISGMLWPLYASCILAFKGQFKTYISIITLFSFRVNSVMFIHSLHSFFLHISVLQFNSHSVWPSHHRIFFHTSPSYLHSMHNPSGTHSFLIVSLHLLLHVLL